MQVNKSGAAPYSANPKSQTGPGAVLPDNLEEFQKHYNQDGQQHNKQDGKEGDPGRPRGQIWDKPEEPRIENLSSIFSHLLTGTASSPLPANLAATGGPAEAAGDFNNLVTGLVDRILTSSTETGGAQEVRLQVSQDLLPDTEIRLSRGLDGLLSVTLVTGRPESFQTLVAAQDSLRTALSGLEEKEVRLTVTGAGTGAGEDGSAERRSRGYDPLEPNDE